MQGGVIPANGHAQGMSHVLFPPVQLDRARLLALASEEGLALMKKTQQLAEEVRLPQHDCVLELQSAGTVDTALGALLC